MDKLNYEQIIADATERFNAIINACINSKDYNTLVGLTCASLYGGEDDMPKENVITDVPALDKDLCFRYKGYQFELSSCNNIIRKEDMLGLTEENFKQRFPHGVFSDRYICWINGHKDIEGHTLGMSDNPENWCPETYLVDGAWCWGAEFDLRPGQKVNDTILSAIDKFLETFEE